MTAHCSLCLACVGPFESGTDRYGSDVVADAALDFGNMQHNIVGIKDSVKVVVFGVRSF